MRLLLDETIRLAQEGKYINRKYMAQVVVDTTVQEKNITYPTDAKQLYKAIAKAVKLARLYGITIRQSYSRKAKMAMIKAGRYAHVLQYIRRDREIRNLKNWLGRLVREFPPIQGFSGQDRTILYYVAAWTSLRRKKKRIVFFLNCFPAFRFIRR